MTTAITPTIAIADSATMLRRQLRHMVHYPSMTVIVTSW